MKQVAIEYSEHSFGEFTLRKDGSVWRLYGEKIKLTPSDASALAELLRNRGKVVKKDEIKGKSRRTEAVKTIQNIRAALGSVYIKKESRCGFIETVQRVGFRWIDETVCSYGTGSLLILPIKTESQETLVALGSHLKSVIAGMVERELNFDVSIDENAGESSGIFSCIIEGSCLYEKGDYLLFLKISRQFEKKENKSFEIQSGSVKELIDEAKTQIIQTVKDLFPEMIPRYKEERLVENYAFSTEQLDTENNEAIKFFLEGEYCWSKRDQQSVLQGLSCFKKAIEADPEFLSPRIGIAKSYVILCLQGSETLYPKDAIPKAVEILNFLEKAEKRRLLSNRQLSDIEAVKGLIYFIYNWNPEKAFASFEKSLQTTPGNYMSRTWYAQCLIRTGNVEKAMTEIEQARADSGYTLSVTNTAYIQTLYLARKYEEAILKAKEILELSPNLRLGHLFWGLAASAMGDLETALEHFEQTYSLLQHSAVISELGYIYGLANKKAEANEMLRQLNKIRCQGNYASYYNDAKIRLGLKQIDECFQALEKAYEERSPWLTQLSCEPTFDSLRADSRYDSFILKIR